MEVSVRLMKSLLISRINICFVDFVSFEERKKFQSVFFVFDIETLPDFVVATCRRVVFLINM